MTTPSDALLADTSEVDVDEVTVEARAVGRATPGPSKIVHLLVAKSVTGVPFSRVPIALPFNRHRSKMAFDKLVARDTLSRPDDLDMAAAVKMHLKGGAQPQNIVWQVAGSVVFGTTSHAEGVALCKTAIDLTTGATINGRLLAQTAVNLAGSTVTAPAL